MQVKLQWKRFGAKEASWELEDSMRSTYPFLFTVKLYIYGVLNTDGVSLRGRGM
jgi:hypothetical protein